ncbi:hypothetical protein [Gordonia sp. NPDC058843]|uniref:hypothetical protein n=1 Tax=Gordonia sp. NPDC058843 TaxID=3346648 RepID=UPI003697F9F9
MAQPTRGSRFCLLVTVIAATIAGVQVVAGAGASSASPLDDLARALPNLGSTAGPAPGYASPQFKVSFRYIESDLYSSRVRPSANVTIAVDDDIDRCVRVDDDERKDQVSKEDRSPGRVTPGGSYTLGFELMGSVIPGCGGRQTATVRWHFRISNSLSTTTFSAALNEQSRLTTGSPSNPDLVQLDQPGASTLIVQVQI